jgi:methylthioribose-1-phosphate isomerase
LSGLFDMKIRPYLPFNYTREAGFNLKHRIFAKINSLLLSMQVNGKNHHTIWVHPDNKHIIQVIDQRKLPFEFRVTDPETPADAFDVIQNMTVRGAPLIGVTGAYGIYLGLVNGKEENWYANLLKSAEYLKSARPTAVNLAILVDEMVNSLSYCTTNSMACDKALDEANRMKSREITWSEAIGDYGYTLIETISKEKNGQPVNILTHCNAGWLACIDWGTATAPIYKAFHNHIPIHVWVDETRPRNQGARLTAWELSEEGVPHTVIPDNTGGHLMQHGLVDLCIVGSDRTTSAGDVANKIGTYLKALAASDNNIPFYVALPSSSIDFSMNDGIHEIPIEQRDGDEVIWMEGRLENGQLGKIRIIEERSAVANYGFDVTPAKYITALITERGICKANKDDILNLFPEKRGRD